MVCRPCRDSSNWTGEITKHDAAKYNAHLGRSGVFWQRHSYDHIVRNESELHAFGDYIRMNPSKACLREGEFLHRSFEWHSKPNVS